LLIIYFGGDSNQENWQLVMLRKKFFFYIYSAKDHLVAFKSAI